MTDQTLQLLLSRLDHLTAEFNELHDGVLKAVRISNDDPEMALTRARKVLEYVVRDVFVLRCKEDPGTRPLENLLQRLVKDGHMPKRLGAYASYIRDLGNVGTHSYGEDLSKEDVRRSFENLTAILEWYFERVRPDAFVKAEAPAHEEEETRCRDEELARKRQEAEELKRKQTADADKAAKLKQDQQDVLLRRTDEVPDEVLAKKNLNQMAGWGLVIILIVSFVATLISNSMIPVALGFFGFCPIFLLYVILKERNIRSGKWSDTHESKKN